MKPLVYIAAPYSRPDPVANTRRAMEVWHELHATGLLAPVCPHWSHFQQLLTPIPYAAWIEHDLEVVRRCDAVYRLPGESPGADRETAEAAARGILVFSDRAALLSWAKAWSGRP